MLPVSRTQVGCTRITPGSPVIAILAACWLPKITQSNALRPMQACMCFKMHAQSIQANYQDAMECMRKPVSMA